MCPCPQAVILQGLIKNIIIVSCLKAHFILRISVKCVTELHIFTNSDFRTNCHSIFLAQRSFLQVVALQILLGPESSTRASAGLAPEVCQICLLSHSGKPV